MVLYALSLPVAVMLIYRALRDLNMDVLKKLYVVILSGAGGNFTGQTQPNKSDQSNRSSSHSFDVLFFHCEQEMHQWSDFGLELSVTEQKGSLDLATFKAGIVSKIVL